MNPSGRQQTVVVGLFVTFAMVILAGGVLSIGTLNDSFSRKIGVRTVFDDVSGLQEGDNVWLSGVKVGRVTALSLRDDASVEVAFTVQREASAHIHADATVQIGSDGLIGNRILTVTGGTPDAPLIADGDLLEAVDSLSPDDVLAVLQENNENVKVITDRLVAGEGTLGRLLADDALYTSISTTAAHLEVATERAEGVTASLEEFTADLNREGTLPHALVSDETTWPKVTATVDSLQATSTRASELVDSVAAGTTDPGTAVGALLHDREAGTDVRTTLDNLAESSDLLTEDLTAVQHSWPFKRYFKKKAKEEAKEAERAP